MNAQALAVIGTGTFGSISTTTAAASTLTVSNTGTFGSIAATSVAAGSVNTNALTSGSVAASSGFIATSGGGFQVFNGTSSPFFVNGQGNTYVNTLTASGTASLQTLTCTGETDTGGLTVSGTGSFGTVISTNQITSLGGFLAKGTTAGFGLYTGSSFPFLVDGSGNTTTQNLTVQGTASLQALTCTGETDTGTLTCTTLTCTGETDSGTLSVGGLLTANGGLVNSTPVRLTLYGVPTGYTYSGGTATSQGSPFTPLQTYLYLKYPSSTSNNWTPSYTTSYRLAIPFTGLYAIQWTIVPAGGTPNFFEFISRSLGANNEFADTWSDQLMAMNTVTSGGASYGYSMSATGYLTTGDYLSFGIFLLSGSWTPYASNRSSITITLIQRTA